MKMSLRHWCTWLLGLALLAFVSAMMYRRRLFSEFPFFGLYAVYHLVYGVVELWVRLKTNMLIWWCVYWARECFDIFVILCVVHEIFCKVLEPYPGLQRAGSRLYRYAALLLITISIGMALSYHTPVIAWIEGWMNNMVRSIHFVEVSLMFLLFVSCRIFGITWRHYLFGIALGFGVKSAMQTVAESLWLQTGWPGTTLSNFLRTFAFLVGLTIWSYFLATKEATVEAIDTPRSPQLSRWNAALEALHAR